MSITHTITKTWQGQTGSPITKSVTLTGNEEINLDFVLNASATNVQYNMVFTVAKLQSAFISSDQAIQLKTNSPSAPQDTLNFTAGDPMQWDINCALAVPFAGNVNTAYFNNLTNVAANVSVRMLTNG